MAVINNAVKVSVIIPTYNRAERICRAVDSVLGQSFDNFECLVVDDGSTDDTAQRLADYTDPRLKVLWQENRGVSAARNFGIANSGGSFIALLDSDDQWVEHKLAKQLSFMEEGGFEISQTDEIWIRKGKRVNQCKKHEKPEGMFFDRSLEMCMVSPSCVIFSRRFWDELGPFDEDMAACEDYDLWLRAGLKYPVGLLRERLTVKHGGRPDQLSNSVGCLDLYRMYAIVKLLNEGTLPAEARSMALAELQRKAAFYIGGCRKRGRDGQAARIERLVRDIVSGNPVSPAEIIKS
ncbi:glycosyltransferase family A protein [Desulfovibrio sp. JC010]|uniref:glycosyltransferase family 2 protein n=1 Tax=Desulfovibrio sp. JC010 TaxID=2593641 RepID=UPI0013D6EFC2|nr:glycosyltransferase family A protein [Desulfovibrio sp. JC010]NDV26952.1 glycosyltransferase family 2 protein [Desulfovibrio sp. JC010]